MYCCFGLLLHVVWRSDQCPVVSYTAAPFNLIVKDLSVRANVDIVNESTLNVYVNYVF